MWGKVIKLARRVDEDRPVVDQSKSLTFLLPRGVALDVRNRRSVSTYDFDVFKRQQCFANVLSEFEDAMFQTAATMAVGNALGDTTDETVARRILVHDTHSPLLNEKKVSLLVGLTGRCTNVDHVHDFRDWRVHGIASGVSFSDHPNQDVESRQSHGFVQGVGELDDVLMDFLVLFFGHTESE
jgi:hypothetical protein